MFLEKQHTTFCRSERTRNHLNTPLTSVYFFRPYFSAMSIGVLILLAYYGFIGVFGVLFNVTLLWLALFRSPSQIRMYRILIVNFAITDMAGAFFIMYVTPRYSKVYQRGINFKLSGLSLWTLPWPTCFTEFVTTLERLHVMQRTVSLFTYSCTPCGPCLYLSATAIIFWYQTHHLYARLCFA